MITWMSIGIGSLRLRAALTKQGKTHLLPFKNWSYPYVPWFVVIGNIFLIFVQGWSCFSPSFDVILFITYYIELPLMVAMFVVWKYLKKTTFYSLKEIDLATNIYTSEHAGDDQRTNWKMKLLNFWRLVF